MNDGKIIELSVTRVKNMHWGFMSIFQIHL